MCLAVEAAVTWKDSNVIALNPLDSLAHSLLLTCSLNSSHLLHGIRHVSLVNLRVDREGRSFSGYGTEVASFRAQGDVVVFHQATFLCVVETVVGERILAGFGGVRAEVGCVAVRVVDYTEVIAGLVLEGAEEAEDWLAAGRGDGGGEGERKRVSEGGEQEEEWEERQTKVLTRWSGEEWEGEQHQQIHQRR